MIGLSLSFADAEVCSWWKDQWIGFPQIAETLTALITGRDALPKQLASLLTAITNGIGNDLARAATHHRPNPTFLPVLQHKRPHFIHFENVFHLSWKERRLKLWIVLVFF